MTDLNKIMAEAAKQLNDNAQKAMVQFKKMAKHMGPGDWHKYFSQKPKNKA